jgi:hypothetical protein
MISVMISTFAMIIMPDTIVATVGRRPSARAVGVPGRAEAA